MKKCFAYILTLLVCLISCDDNTGSLGGSVVPGSDIIIVDTASYWATSKSIAVDSVLGKTNKVYLGRFTDPQTSSVLEADFIAQFNCEEGGNVFPEVIPGDCAVKVELRLFFSNYFGDPTNTMTAEVYELKETLKEGKRYYTNLKPSQFKEGEPLATKVYTLTDYTLEDSELEDSERYANVNIPLPAEVGTKMIRQYRRNRDLFANATNFIDSVCKGYYVTASQGDGTILYVDQATLNVYFKDSDSDSIFVTQFAGTEEVLQANRFNTKPESLKPLVDDNSCTYLKTPAGLFTEVELPVDDILADNDTINAAKIFFDCIYDDYVTDYKFGIPQILLMVHKDEMYSFFEKNRLTDDVSSFYTMYNSTYNRYEYNNIARLIAYCDKKRDESENWNKVVLIPVSTITDSNSNIVNFRHDFSVNSVRLVGGKDKVRIKVITSKFN